MFMAAERQPKMRAMIMADDEAGRRGGARSSCSRSSSATSRGCSRRWPDSRSTIRLLDPPLHEFLPDRYELHEEIVRARIEEARDCPSSSTARAIRGLEETNPMLGTRGVRLGCSTRRSTRCRCVASCERRCAVASRDRSGSQARDHDPAGGLRARARVGRARGCSRSPRRRASPTARTSASAR